MELYKNLIPGTILYNPSGEENIFRRYSKTMYGNDIMIIFNRADNCETMWFFDDFPGYAYLYNKVENLTIGSPIQILMPE
tara:strand:- start:95 stop:334 length:240 start_codon:yes stop_codon:yes gene_type:complete